MQVKSIAECSKGSILQYFRPSSSYHLSLRSLFCLFLSGCLTQDLLYNEITGNINFLILDPHYTGAEDLKVIQDKMT